MTNPKKVSKAIKPATSFGERLRVLRNRQKMSQMTLSQLADTTPRYISFIETGRSRPGHDVVVRISKALKLDIAQQNLLLTSAGLTPLDVGRQSGNKYNVLLRNTIQDMLDKHSPFPGYAIDNNARIVFSNRTFDAIFPNTTNQTTHDSMENFFTGSVFRDVLENWSELAWAFIDRDRLEAARTGDPKLLAITEMALALMQGSHRPDINETKQLGSMVLYPKFRLDGHVYSTYMTLLRFEGIVESILSNLRLALIYPLDDEAKAYFAEKYEALP